jgi:hypothetical protein
MRNKLAYSDTVLFLKVKKGCLAEFIHILLGIISPYSHLYVLSIALNRTPTHHLWSSSCSGADPCIVRPGEKRLRRVSASERLHLNDPPFLPFPVRWNNQECGHIRVRMRWICLLALFPHLFVAYLAIPLC